MTVSLSIEEIKWMGENIALYKPVGEAQRGFHTSCADFRWLLGGNQSSKTYASMMDLALICLDIHPVIFKPRGLHWACIESWEQVRDILWQDNLKKFFPSYHIINVMWSKDKIPRKVYFKNGHIIEFKAFNQGRDLFQGRAVDTVHCDEQCHYDFQGILEELQARLMAKDGSMAWSMTPIIPQPFLEERIEDLPDTDETFKADLNDNRISRGGHIPDKKIDKMIADWPVEVQATRIKGEFASFYGAVFKTFNRKTHVIKPFAIPKHWRKYRGFDFGFTNPFVCLWFAQDKDENWYVYREYYRAQATIGDHIPVVKNRSAEEKYVANYADPENAEDRAYLRGAGIITKAARKDVSRGIEVVQGRLKIKEDGKPSLYIFNTCRNTCREMVSYHYPTGTSSRNPKDIPVQKEDHTIDTVRYVLYSVEKPRRKGSVYAA